MFIFASLLTPTAQAGPAGESIQDILQNTEFPSGFLATRDCANQLLVNPAEADFKALALKDKIFHVHRITHPLWDEVTLDPARGPAYARSPEALTLAHRLRLIGEADGVEAFREELIAISWDISGLLQFSRTLPTEAISSFVFFQIAVASMPPAQIADLSEARATLELNVYANLMILYATQFRGQRPMNAIANSVQIMDLAIQQGERGPRAMIDTITRPALTSLWEAMNAYPRIPAANRESYVALTEYLFNFVGSLARGMLESDTEFSRHQKEFFIRQVKWLRENERLAQFPTIEKTTSLWVQLFEKKPAGGRAN